MPNRADSGRAVLRGVAFAALFVLAGITRNALLAFAAAAVLATGVVPVGRMRVTLDRRLPDRVSVGDDVPYDLIVRNQGRLTTTGFLVVDRSPGFEPVTVAVPPLRPGEAADLHLTRTAVARTVSAQWPGAWVTHGFFDGRRSRDFLQPARVVVRPRVLAVPAARAGGARRRAEDRGPERLPDRRGTAPAGVRPWRPGDPVAAVHWRSTARAGTPVVVEHRDDDTAPATVIVALDAAAGPEFETAVSRAAGLAVAAARDGADLTIVASPPAPPVPDGGDPDAVLDWLAALGPTGLLTREQLELVLHAAAGGAVVATLCRPGSEAAATLLAAVRRAGGTALDLAQPEP